MAARENLIIVLGTKVATKLPTMKLAGLANEIFKWEKRFQNGRHSKWPTVLVANQKMTEYESGRCDNGDVKYGR